VELPNAIDSWWAKVLCGPARYSNRLMATIFAVPNGNEDNLGS